MNKSKELDNILDECLNRLMFKGETLEQCLRHYPKHVDELKPLLEAALVTSRLSSLEPSPEFKDKARVQLYTALRKMESKRSRSFFNLGWRPQWVAVTAVVLALFLAGGSTAAAASGSMPDDFLYPVKRATEQVQLAFTFTSIGKAEFHTRMADRRVEEIVYLANENKTEKIEMLVASLETSLTKIPVLLSTQETVDIMVVEKESEALLAGSVEATEEEENIDTPALTTATAEESLSEETSSEAARVPESKVIAEPVQGKAQRVGSGNQVQAGADRRVNLSVTMVNQANRNISQLRKILEIVPESARPAILRAIAIYEQGYENAIESLD